MTEEDSAPNSWSDGRLYAGLFAFVVIFAIVLRIYKAYYTGIIYDEALTYFRFAKDFKSAFSNYSSTNNHLLNSVFIHISVAVFGQRGSFLGIPAIRLPAVFFGIVYTIAISAVIAVTLRDRLLKILILTSCLFNHFIFDLTILARGYAIGMGAVYLELLLIVLYPRHLKGRDKSMVIAMSVLNFMVIGGMLTSVYTIIPLNVVFLAVAFHTKKHTGSASPEALKKVFEVGSGILWFSSFALSLLYFQIARTIIEASDELSEVKLSPITILKSLIDDGIFSGCLLHAPPDTVPLVIIATALLFTLLAVLFALNYKKAATVPALAILSVLTASFSLSCIVYWAAGVSLGFTRNHVFWLPLIILSAGVLADGAKAARAVLFPLIVLILLILTAVSFMSPYVVTINDWRQQSVVGPLLRQLKKTDPGRHWMVGFSDKLPYNLFPYLFYNG
ncbi:MAG: hypothetical protein L7F77_13095, partial [Candidatus Magnetominusculus sp. LBB02]|nr:hypothetical protein [Candidatus Magnetominusculus sp. LBB02]